MEVPAKLGLYISGEGARREISLTTDQLRKLANGGHEATAVMRELNGELAGSGGAGGGEPPENRIDRITAAIGRMQQVAAAPARFDVGLDEALSREIALLDPFQRAVQRSEVAVDRLTAARIRMRDASRGAADLKLATQIEQADPFQKNIATALDPIPPKANAARLSLGRLGNQFAGLAGSIAGVHPVIGNVLGVFGQFAIGGGVTTAVIAGLAILTVAWSKFTEKIREQAAEQEKLIKTGLDAQRLRALGPGGQSAATATAAGEQLTDLQQKRDELDGVFNRIFKSGYVLPGQNAAEKARIDQEMGLIKLLQQRANLENELARTRAFATSVTSPFDYAESRGRSLDGFYKDALAAEAQLTELAKSGAQDVADTARSALSDIENRLDRLRLQGLGLAAAPSRLLGLPSDKAIGGIRQTVGDLRGAITEGGRGEGGPDVRQFSDAILTLSRTIQGATDDLPRGSDRDTLGIRTAVAEQARQMTTLFESLQMALAKTDDDREAIAARVRGAQGAGGGFVQNIEAQQAYGTQLAARKAALALPAIFDADAESVLRHGEAMRSLRQELDLSINNFRSVDAAVGSFKEGLLEAAKDFMSSLSPSNLAQGLLGGVFSTVTNFAQGLLSRGAEAIRRSIFGSTSEQRQAEHAAAIAQQQLANTLEGLRASLTGDSLGVSLASARNALIGLLEQINAALPGTKNEAARNAARADAERLERQQEARIKDDDARRRREMREDLEVRMLRAQGQDMEADALALRREQEREYADALRDGADAAYLASLVQVQAAERTRAAMESLQDAVRGGPSGFRLEDYGLGQAYFGPRDGSGGGALPGGVPGGSHAPTTVAGSGLGGAHPANLTMNFGAGALVIQARPGESDVQLARRFANGLRTLRTTHGGPNTTLSDTLEVIS